MARKRQFDDEKVLSVISEYFWEHGFSATKVDQLSAVTGLTKTSLYNAFGNKEALFERSVDFYVEQGLAPLEAHMDVDKSMSENLSTLLQLTFSEIYNPLLTHGCLLTNSILELKSNEPRLYDYVTKRYEEVHEVMHRFFEVYTENGRVSSEVDADDLTYLYMTFRQGLKVQSRNSEPQKAIESSIKTFLLLIKSVEVEA